MTRSPYRPWLLLLLAGCLLAYALQQRMISIPDRWNPWAPLNIDDRYNWLTRWKLMRVSGDAQACLDLLAETGMRFTVVPDRSTGPGCGFRTAVRIERTATAAVEPFTLSCRTALSLAFWERHVLQVEASAYFDQRVARIEHFGSYACRNVYSREGASRSRHATADALDMAGFVLDDGRSVRIVNDWPGETMNETDHAKGLFLDALHDGACRYFDTVLGPDYNTAHADHFHVDRGGYRLCR